MNTTNEHTARQAMALLAHCCPGPATTTAGAHRTKYRKRELPLDTKKSCSWCGNQKKLQVCSGCKVARYCGTQCQKAHRKEHKGLCLQVYDRMLLFSTGDPVVDDKICLNMKSKAEQAVSLSIQQRARAQGFGVPEECPVVD